MLARQIVFLLITLTIATTSTAADVSREQKLKAAYIYNLAKLIDWPDQLSSSDSGTFNVCILENSTMFAAALSIQGKAVAGKTLKAREIKSSEANQDCNILYFSKPEQLQLLQSIENLPVLTMGDVGDFANKGGIIHLFIESNKIKFKINEKTAIASGLTISPKLLKLASKVIN